jgi:hypothetical protein
MPAGRGRERTLAYMLRLWQVTEGALLAWRASLQDVRTGEQLDLLPADLDGAYRYLRAQIELASGGSPGREALRKGVSHGG